MIPLIILAAGGLVAIVLAVLNWDKIIDWFRGHQELKESDKDNIAFTLQERLNNGKFRTIEGVFNKTSEKLLDGVKYESKEIDEQLAEVHKNNELVVYE